MRDWPKIFSRKETTQQFNKTLSMALAHCPVLDGHGWNFRCVECHVSDGTYQSGFGVDWHFHAEYQIEIAVAGSFEFATDDAPKFVLRPGRALFIPWKTGHKWKCIRPGVMIGISLELLPSPVSIQHDGWLVNRIEKVMRPAVKIASDELLIGALEKNNPSFRVKTTACRLFILLAEILQSILPSKTSENSSSAKVAAETRGRETVGLVVRHVEENLGAALNLAQVARETGLSTRQVHRLFLKHVGKSLHEYLLERRLEEARKQISEKGKTLQIKEIAYRCGFNSLAYFSSCFRKTYGVPPSSLLLKDVPIKSGFTVYAHEAKKTKTS